MTVLGQSIKQSINESHRTIRSLLCLLRLHFLPESQRPRMILGKSGSFLDCPVHEDIEIFTLAAQQGACTRKIRVYIVLEVVVRTLKPANQDPLSRMLRSRRVVHQLSFTLATKQRSGHIRFCNPTDILALGKLWQDTGVSGNNEAFFLSKP